MINAEDYVRFSQEIEKLVWDKDLSYMEAVILYCENTGFEIEMAAKLITGSLKNKIRVEAESLNFLPKSNNTVLPFQ
jgi:hypothetical protein